MVQMDFAPVKMPSSDCAPNQPAEMVTFNGHQFHKNLCYEFEHEEGSKLMVGIVKFVSESHAKVSLIWPFSETLLGRGEEEGVNFAPMPLMEHV